MPTTRRRRTRNVMPGLTPYQRAWLLDADLPEEDPNDVWWRVVTRHHAGGTEHEGELWASHRDDLLAEFVAEKPGRRPDAWWTYDAPRELPGRWPGCYFDGKLPLLRCRLGGTGTPVYEVQGRVPALQLGLPAGFVGADPSDPPTFESQATYLKRLGLLLPGEERRLKPGDFRPEVILSDLVEIAEHGHA